MVSVARWVPELWGMLDEAGREKLRQFVLTGPSEQLNGVMPQVARIDGLKHLAAARLRRSNATELALFIKKDIGDIAIDRAIELYTTVGSWVEANQQTDNLILPLLPRMAKSHIETILEAARTRKADLIGSNGFSLLIEKIPHEKILTTQELDKLLTDAGLEEYTSAKRAKPIDLNDIPF